MQFIFDLTSFMRKRHRIINKYHMRFKRETDLTSMCLNVIADNIERFVKRQYECEEETVNVYIEFLRRMYSDRLYKMIKMKEKYITSSIIDLFLTPYWKDVRMYRFDYSSARLFRRLKSMGNTITSLNLEDSTASSDMLTAVLCCVPNVNYLNLICTECNDSVLALISKTLKSLVTLNLSECEKVTDTGIAHLYNLDRKEIGFNSLKALNIHETSVTDKSIPLILKYLTSLQYLKYNVMSFVLYDFHVSGIISDDARYNLASFEYLKPSHLMQQSRFEDVNLINLLQSWSILCPRVTRICIKETVNENFLQLCSKFEHLSILRLVNDDFTALDFSNSEFFKLRGAQLTEIHLKYVSVSVEIIAKLCQSLKKLTLDKVSFEDFDEYATQSEVLKLNELEFFTLNHADLKIPSTFKSTQFLITSCKNLVKLSITYSENFSDDVATCILNSPSLTTLNFSFTDIKPETLSSFFSSENINSICVDGGPYVSKIYEASETFKSVNDNPHGNTCSWKIDFCDLEDSISERWIDTTWAAELSI